MTTGGLANQSAQNGHPIDGARPALRVALAAEFARYGSTDRGRFTIASKVAEDELAEERGRLSPARRFTVLQSLLPHAVAQGLLQASQSDDAAQLDPELDYDLRHDRMDARDDASRAEQPQR